MEQPPISPDALKEYVYRQLVGLESDINQLDKIQPRTAIPAKPIIGKIYYFSNIVLPAITVEGYWGYKSTGWVLIA